MARTEAGDGGAMPRALGIAAPGRLHLLVIAGGAPVRHALPEAGVVSVGGGDCDVRIDHPSIGRRHALLHLGPTLKVEDLGSAGGTRVGGAPLTPGAPTPFHIGQIIELGESMILVQRRAEPTRPRRIWSHDYFESRLENECARAEEQSARFAVARVHLEHGAPAEEVHAAMVELLRPADVVGAYGPDEYEALLVDTERDEAQRRARVIAAGLGRVGRGVRVGVACYPEDGRSPDALVARADGSARGQLRAVEPPAAERPIVIVDETVRDLYRTTQRVAAGTLSVLLLGETGVGKEVFAESVHRLSPRAEKPFLRLNCAALSEHILESELFGHEKGAFTGAGAAKPGLLETAGGGTVLLDEVGELPLTIQVKLLRVLEDRTVMRVGGLRPRAVDVRFVAATNRDLEAEVARGRFREDLFYRLNGIALTVPPLRQRPSEIEPLARLFVVQAARSLDLAAAPALGAEALGCLRAYAWPGNIRELRNMMERAVLLCGDGRIGVEHLPAERMRSVVLARATALLSQAPAMSVTTPAPPAPAAASPAEGEAVRRILEALTECGGNQTRAATLLGVSRRTLINRIKKHGIARPRKA